MWMVAKVKGLVDAEYVYWILDGVLGTPGSSISAEVISFTWEKGEPKPIYDYVAMFDLVE